MIAGQGRPTRSRSTTRARPPRGDRRLRRLRPTRRADAGARGGRRPRARAAARREDPRAGRRRRARPRRDRRLLRRQRDLGARRAARAGARRSPTRASATSAGRCASSDDGRHATRRASTGATRCGSAALESRLASVTGGNGAIYATRRSAYLVVDPIMGHDLSFPFNMVKRGLARRLRAGGAGDREDGAHDRGRVRAQAADDEPHAGRSSLRGGMLSPRGYRPLYALMIVSHRLLRYASPFLHARWRWRATSRCVARRRGALYRVTLAAPARAARGRAAGPARCACGRCSSRATTCSPPPRWPPGCGTGCATARRPGGRRRRGRGERADGPCGRSTSSARRWCSCWPRRCWPLAALPSGSSRAGHPIYRQRRVGTRRRAVRHLKLRTMVDGAEHIGAGLAVNEGDPRITRVGALLRRTSLDELPNLVNVAARRDVARRPAADDAGAGRPVHAAPARPAGGQAGHHRLGAGQRARVAAVVRADRARPLVRRAPLAARSTCRSSLRTPRDRRSAATGLYKGETGGWQSAVSGARPSCSPASASATTSSRRSRSTRRRSSPTPTRWRRRSTPRTCARAVPRIDDPDYVPALRELCERVRRRRRACR